MLIDSKHPHRVTVCIAKSAGESAFVAELCGMLVDELELVGCRPLLVGDGDRTALDAAALLLFEDGRLFPRYARLFQGLAGKKPVTLLWQMDSLPPPDFGSEEERIGMTAIEQCSRLRLPLGWMKDMVPPAVKSVVREALRWMFFSRFRQSVAADSQEGIHAVGETLQEVMLLRYGWLKEQQIRGWLDHIFVNTQPKRDFLASRGIPARVVPFGYHPGLGERQTAVRDIDVVCLGFVYNQRRRIALETLGRKLKMKGIRLVTVDKGCYGLERTRLLNRARISLNLLNYPWDFGGERFLMSMGCGALVVSERLDSPEPYQPGVHLAHGDFDDLPDVIEHYLSDEGARDTIVERAFQFVTRELTLAQSVADILRVAGLVDGRPAALAQGAAGPGRS